MTFACHPDGIGMTILTKSKGGDAYGKVPKRIAADKPFVVAQFIGQA
jgi:hypothetical protein